LKHAPSLAALALLARYGRETRQRDLRELDVESTAAAEDRYPRPAAAVAEPGLP